MVESKVLTRETIAPSKVSAVRMKICFNILLLFAILVINAVCQGQATSHILPIYIRSEGCNDPGITGCGRAVIRVNGNDVSQHKRGYNIVVVHGNTGNVESSTSFDTFDNDHAHSGMIWHLHNIPKGRLVLVAIQDEGSKKMSNSAYDALKRFGARNQIRFNYRSSYALLGWSGDGQLSAVTQVQRKRYQGPSIISTVLSIPLL